jgi:hypothetical protein
VLVAAVKPQGRSMPATAVSQEFFSIRISLTSTLRFIRKSSMPLFATRPTCWTACSTMNPTCGSKSITQTQLASPIMYSLSCIFSAVASLHASAISPIEGFTFPNCRKDYPALRGIIGGVLNLRLATSIEKGTVTASLMLRKLGSYPRQNGLAVALRELGRIERTLFTLDWLQNTELRRRVHVGLNKGEAKNALGKAVFFNRWAKCAIAASRTSVIVLDL